jgi:hypothetical protein
MPGSASVIFNHKSIAQISSGFKDVKGSITTGIDKNFNFFAGAKKLSCYILTFYAKIF